MEISWTTPTIVAQPVSTQENANAKQTLFRRRVGGLVLLGRLPGGRIQPDSVRAIAGAGTKTVLEILDRPQISKINRISDNNLLRFEIEADKTENNQELMTWDIVVAANGKLMKLSKEVPYFALSYPQMQTIEARYPASKSPKPNRWTCILQRGRRNQWPAG